LLTGWKKSLNSSQMRAELGIPVLVENRPGANGAVAAVVVKNALPDGKILLFISSSMATISPHLDKNLPYDRLRDFAPVASVAYIDGVMVVGAKVSANNLKEFVQLARASRPPLVFGSPGTGNQSHINLEQFKDAAKIDLLHVPYKGAAIVLTEVLGGQITGTFIGVSTALPHIRSGKLKAFAVSGKKRSAIAPDIPTFEEQGYSGLDKQAWTGILAARNTRPEMVKALANAVSHAVEQDDTRAKLLSGGMTPWVVMGDEFGRSIRSESERYKNIIVQKNIAGE
jgi:tripartite-type tricarboxylate transporter receptor subunit TctC